MSGGPFRRYPGYVLPDSHPYAGRTAWRCGACEGFFFPPAEPPDTCPYCDEDGEA